MFSFYIVCSVNNENKTAKDDSPKSACNMRNPADNDSDATDTENVFDCENLTADDRDHGVTSEDKNVLTQTYVDSVQNSDDVEGLPEKVSNKDGMKHKKKKSSDGQIAKKSRRVRQDCDKSPGGAVSQLTSVLGGGFGRLCDKCGRLVGGKHRCQREVKKDPVECPECGIKCSNRPNLRRHMMQHTGERPHLCQHCGAGVHSATVATGSRDIISPGNGALRPVYCRSPVPRLRPDVLQERSVAEAHAIAVRCETQGQH
jgi:hypothetical protein